MVPCIIGSSDINTANGAASEISRHRSLPMSNRAILTVVVGLSVLVHCNAAFAQLGTWEVVDTSEAGSGESVDQFQYSYGMGGSVYAYSKKFLPSGYNGVADGSIVKQYEWKPLNNDPANQSPPAGNARAHVRGTLGPLFTPDTLVTTAFTPAYSDDFTTITAKAEARIRGPGSIFSIPPDMVTTTAKVNASSSIETPADAEKDRRRHDGWKRTPVDFAKTFTVIGYGDVSGSSERV